MRVIIAGSRNVWDYTIVETAMNNLSKLPTEVVSGTAKGVDKLGEKWAKLNAIPVKRFPAKWNVYGKRAGYLRNAEMARYADGLVAIWDGKSRGTMHMIDIAKACGMKVYVYRTDKN
jgi:hypothetical protein